MGTMARQNNQSGFAVLETVLILVIVGLVGFTGWYVWHSKQTTEKTYTQSTNTINSSVNTTKYKLVTQEELMSCVKHSESLAGGASAVFVTNEDGSINYDILECNKKNLDGSTKTIYAKALAPIKTQNAQVRETNLKGLPEDLQAAIIKKGATGDQGPIDIKGALAEDGKVLYSKAGFARYNIGAVTYWAKVGNEWKNILSTQDVTYCAFLAKYDVPAGIAKGFTTDKSPAICTDENNIWRTIVSV
jgi:hypothetical protein